MTRDDERTLTLQLARLIADAVLEAAVYGRSSNDWKDEPTQAVLRTLERWEHALEKKARP